MLLLLGMGLMDIACDKEEKGTKETGQVTPKVGEVQTLKAQTTDALSGKPVNKNIYADYEGKRIYFCCDQSKKDFQKNPEVYLTKFREQGVILEVISTER
jgi:YHS domain-containing protein